MFQVEHLDVDMLTCLLAPHQGVGFLTNQLSIFRESEKYPFQLPRSKPFG